MKELCMKSLKSLIAFVFPLVMMLSSFSIYLLVNKLVNNYKDGIANEYSMVVVASEEIVDMYKLTSVDFQRVDKIDRTDIIDDVKDDLSNSSLSMLGVELPYFYQVYFKEFPTNTEVQDIKKQLLAVSSINEVEIFESEHIKLYSLLVLTKDIVTTLFIIVLVSSFLMLLQQIRILFFEYSEKISILQLLGASLFYSTKSILGSIIVSIFLSLFVVLGLMFFLITEVSFISQPELLYIVPKVEEMSFELIQIVSLAVIIPIIAFIALIIKHRLNNDV